MMYRNEVSYNFYVWLYICMQTNTCVHMYDYDVKCNEEFFI